MLLTKQNISQWHFCRYSVIILAIFSTDVGNILNPSKEKFEYLYFIKKPVSAITGFNNNLVQYEGKS
jgi:hypothetical protein